LDMHMTGRTKRIQDRALDLFESLLMMSSWAAREALGALPR